MILLSDCLSKRDDEGYAKIAKNIAERLSAKKSVSIVAVNDDYSQADKVIRTRNGVIALKLIPIILRQNILYLSPGSNSIGTALKILFLSLFAKSITTVFVQRIPMKFSVRLLLRMSRVKIVCMSKAICDFYKQYSDNKVIYIPVGIDKRILESDKQTLNKSEIRKKYGIEDNDIVILHVGHMRKGRNIERLFDLDPKYKKVLVTSSSTEHEYWLRDQYKDRKDIKIIDEYIHNIGELYSMCDLYFFPVVDVDFCIGIPMSVIEAAACNRPILTTRFGDLSYFEKIDGFDFFEPDDTNQVLTQKIEKLLGLTSVKTSELINGYDWEMSVHRLEEIINER